MTVGPRYCAYFSPIIRPPLAIGHSRFSIRSISLGLLRVSGFGFRVHGCTIRSVTYLRSCWFKSASQAPRAVLPRNCSCLVSGARRSSTACEAALALAGGCYGVSFSHLFGISLVVPGLAGLAFIKMVWCGLNDDDGRGLSSINGMDRSCAEGSFTTKALTQYRHWAVVMTFRYASEFQLNSSLQRQDFPSVYSFMVKSSGRCPLGGFVWIGARSLCVLNIPVSLTVTSSLRTSREFYMGLPAGEKEKINRKASRSVTMSSTVELV